MKKLTRLIKNTGLAMVLLLLLCFPAKAEEQLQTARDITAEGMVTDQQGFFWSAALFDGDLLKHTVYSNGSWLTLSAEEKIGSLYLIFDYEYDSVILTDAQSGERRIVDTQGMVHKYIDVESCFGEPLESLTICFESGDVLLNELRFFSSGQAPEWVQQWDTPADDVADLVLFSTHGDDEQLFFAGVLPYYAGELGMDVQVVYMTNHREHTNVRVHEMLNGLYAVGVRHYPIFGTFPDFRVPTLENTLQIYANMGYQEEEMLGYVVEQLRRFKPNVALGHDLNGEYGHGMHMLYARLLSQACQISSDPERFPESAEKYGTWDVPKTYLHLYETDPIWVDWDIPLSRFDGMTAYEVTRDLGYPCHESQYKDFIWYYDDHDTAADVDLYSPCAYGLLRSTVGPDMEKNNFFENIGILPAEETAAVETEETEIREESAEAEVPETTAETAPETVPTVQSVPTEETAEPGNRMLQLLCITAAVLAIALVVLERKEKKKNF